MAKLTRDQLRQAMAEMGAKGGKHSLVTMSPEERSVRAKKASLAAAKKRTEMRLEREGKSAKKAPKKSSRKATLS
jgi:hypothetical protein